MYIFLIIVCISLIAGIILSFDTAWNLSEGIGIVSSSLAIGVCIAFVVSLLTSGFAQKEYVKTNEYMLVNLQDSSTVSGSFFLGSGFVNGEWEYVFYRK